MFVKDDKTRFRPEWGCQVKSCTVFWQVVFLSPVRKNSVLEELKVGRLAVIREEMC